MKKNIYKPILVALLILPLLFTFQNCGKISFTKFSSQSEMSSADFLSLSSATDRLPTSELQPVTLPPINSASATTTTAPTNKLLTDSVFASTSFWYQPIPLNVPLNPNSAAMVTDFVDQRTRYYNSVGVNTYSYSSPVFYVSSTVPTQKVTQWDCQNKGYLDSNLAQMWAQVPIPANAEPSAGTDGEMSVYQASTDTLWEFRKVRKNLSGGWEACWGGRLQQASKSPGYFPGYYGTTATSLPFLGGQVTAEELQRGEIRHAIGIAMVNTTSWSNFSWPAQRSDGNGYGAIPEGLRFRLDPTINVDALNIHPIAKIIAKAGQKYGFILWDKAGAISVRFQNPISYTSQGQVNPYPALFNGTPNYALLNGIPWNRLQFLPMNYGKP